jgi:hypothetical protein
MTHFGGINYYSFFLGGERKPGIPRQISIWEKTLGGLDRQQG